LTALLDIATAHLAHLLLRDTRPTADAKAKAKSSLTPCPFVFIAKILIFQRTLTFVVKHTRTKSSSYFLLSLIINTRKNDKNAD
jgi:hypothetical protein